LFLFCIWYLVSGITLDIRHLSRASRDSVFDIH
jgi:hypothetical protein